MWKKFRDYRQPVKLFTTRNKREHVALDTWRQDMWSDDRFKFFSVIRERCVYKYFYTYFRKDTYFRAEENQIIAMIVLPLQLSKTILSLEMCLGILLVWSTSIEPYWIPHHVLNEKKLNWYTGNYKDIWGLLSIREILKIFYPQK